ncbi:MAG: cation acetate symporter [Anaerolineales bacterium]|nr:cation acetate symporter [Anaerolineales bacterium]
MSVEMWTWLLVGISFIGYIWIGYTNRVNSTKGFYVAGQGVPAIANGAATAADWMSGASFISMAGLIAFMGYDGTVYLLGWTGGYVLLATLLAPYLRKFNKYTVPDFVGDRYYSQTARIVAAVCAVFVSFTYVAGQMRGVGIVFSRFLEISVTWGVVIGMVIVAFFAVLGGMKGITYTQVAQYCVIIIAFLIPAFTLSARVSGNPIPQLALTFTDIVPKLDAIQTDLGLGVYSTTTRPLIDIFCIMLALMAGTAGLPHVIVRFYTVKSVRDARYSAGWALLFIALLYTTAPALAVFAKLNLINTLNNVPTTAIAEGTDLDWAWKWQQTGLLQFTDLNGDGVYTLSGGDTNEIVIDRDIIVLSTPEVAGLSGFVIALVAAGGLAAALSTASGLLLVISSSFAHDIYYRWLRPEASEEERLRVGRIAIVGAIFLAGYLGINPPGFVGEVVAFAFGLAAASFFPVIFMGIFDKRANDKGAIAGMVVGIIFTALMIVLMRSDRLLGTSAPIISDVMGISSQGIGVIGMILNFAIAYVVSRQTEAPPEHIQEMVESVRIPAGAATAAAQH